MFDVKPVTSKKSSDCGAACMVSFLGYYGEEVTLDQMVRECCTKVQGSTGKDLITCGRAHGLDMKAWRTDTGDIVRNFDRPAIIWWKYNHWCIYCGLNDFGQVVICNPSRGRYAVSVSLFNAFYSGVCLTNETPPDGEGIPDEEED